MTMPATTTSTSLLVRVQARGGKFLADDIGGAEISVRNVHTGQYLGGGLAHGTSSGNLQTNYVANASQNAVVTPGNPPGSQPKINWLVPQADTSGVLLDVPIERPALLEVSAWGPLGGLQSAQRVTTTTWATPGMTIDQGPGLVMEMPGLIVDVLTPPTHSNSQSALFLVKVTMMCGCQISDAAG